MSIADFAAWPVLHAMELAHGSEDDFVAGLKALGLEALGAYYSTFKKRACVGQALKTGADGSLGCDIGHGCARLRKRYKIKAEGLMGVCFTVYGVRNTFRIAR